MKQRAIENGTKIMLILGLSSLTNISIISHTNTFEDIRSVMYRTDTFHVVEQEKIDTNSLVIFDVDDVLTISEDPWDRRYGQERKQAKTIHSLYINAENTNLIATNALSREIKNMLFSIFVQSNKSILIESDAAAIIQQLQQSGIRVIALTDFPVGEVGIIKSLENWRIDRLLSLGIDLSSSIVGFESIIFKQFVHENIHPLFKSGILFTGARVATKGQLLQAFLEHINWLPSKVIMFDDNKKNLESVQKELKTMGIPFVGYEYTGAQNVPAYFDKNIAEFQFQYLINNQQWLTGSQAQELLQKSPLYAY